MDWFWCSQCRMGNRRENRHPDIRASNRRTEASHTTNFYPALLQIASGWARFGTFRWFRCMFLFSLNRHFSSSFILMRISSSYTIYSSLWIWIPDELFCFRKLWFCGLVIQSRETLGCWMNRYIRKAEESNTCIRWWRLHALPLLTICLQYGKPILHSMLAPWKKM